MARTLEQAIEVQKRISGTFQANELAGLVSLIYPERDIGNVIHPILGKHGIDIDEDSLDEIGEIIKGLQIRDLVSGKQVVIENNGQTASLYISYTLMSPFYADFDAIRKRGFPALANEEAYGENFAAMLGKKPHESLDSFSPSEIQLKRFLERYIGFFEKTCSAEAKVVREHSVFELIPYLIEKEAGNDNAAMARCLILLGMDERATKRLLAKTFLSSEFTVREYLRQAAAYPGDLTAEIEVHSVYTRRVREERDKEIKNLRKKVTGLKTVISDGKEERESLPTRLCMIEGELNSAREETARYKAELSSTQSSSDTMDALRRQMKGLENKLDGYQEDLLIYQTLFAEGDKENKRLTNAMARVTSEMEMLREELGMYRGLHALGKKKITIGIIGGYKDNVGKVIGSLLPSGIRFFHHDPQEEGSRKLKTATVYIILARQVMHKGQNTVGAQMNDALRLYYSGPLHKLPYFLADHHEKILGQKKCGVE